MKVSLNWIKQFGVSVPNTDKLIAQIGAQLGAVDEVIDLSARYSGAVVVKIESCVAHPNADKLSVCMINDGKAIKNVERDDKGLVQVVCGAPNVAAGQTVVWLPPGATVPSTYDKDPFVLEARELRGIVSNGMLASAKELALGDDHSGILVLEDNLKPGQSFASAYELDDLIIDIENKMFTHRPDLFGQLGIAREVAGISGHKFVSPTWYKPEADINNDGRKNVLPLSIDNQIPDLVPRFSAVVIKDVKISDSPAWLRAKLAAVGIRPINNIVDITNYMMMMSAQPLHAYDYDKVKTAKLGMRLSKSGEELQGIGGKNIKLAAGAVVITDGSSPIGLGGVMGGASTEVSYDTKNIILEAANFNMNVTRKTAMEYGLFTDAATRFTKNQSPAQTKAVLVKAVEELRKVAGGRVASSIIDSNNVPDRKHTVSLSADFVCSRLGLKISPALISKLLSNVEFSVKQSADKLDITVPFWRTDIEIPEDIVEEVGRLYGYDHLPLELPGRPARPTDPDRMLTLGASVRSVLSAAGANEVLTYSFVHGSLLQKAGQDPAKSYHIKNALSPALQYYRQSLMPSLLDKVHPNIKNGFSEFALFEIGKGHIKKDGKDLPNEMQILALVYANNDKASASSAYFNAKNYLHHLCWETMGIKLNYSPIADELDFAIASPYQLDRSALVSADGKILGIVGEFRADVLSAFKLPKKTAGFEIDLSSLSSVPPARTYMPLNKFPETIADITFRVSAEISYAKFEEYLLDQLTSQSETHGYKTSLTPISIFQKEEDQKHKQTTWRVRISHPERTLTTNEVNKLFGILEDSIKKEFKAERV